MSMTTYDSSTGHDNITLISEHGLFWAVGITLKHCQQDSAYAVAAKDGSARAKD